MDPQVRRAKLASQIMQVDAKKASELQKSQAELKVLKATVVEIREQLKESDLDLKLEIRKSNALSQQLNLLTEFLIPLVRCGIRNGRRWGQLYDLLDNVHNGMVDSSEDDERSLLGDWKSDRQEAKSSDTTTEDRGSAGEPTATAMDTSWLNFN